MKLLLGLLYGTAALHLSWGVCYSQRQLLPGCINNIITTYLGYWCFIWQYYLSGGAL